MKLFIRRIALFIGLLITISYPISNYIDNNFHTYSKQNWILTLENQTFDFAFIGSSRVFHMIDALTINNVTQKTSINLGTSAGCFAENYLLFNEFVKKNSVKKLFINVDEFSFNALRSFGKNTFHYFELLPFSNDTSYKKEFETYVPSWKQTLWKYLPIFKYIEYNNLIHLKSDSFEEFNKSLGTRLISSNGNFNSSKKTRHEGINQTDVLYFKQLVALCAKKSINVVLITTPIYCKEEEELNHNKPLNALINSSQLQYIPYNSLIDCSKEGLFDDETHTNQKGTIEYSYRLAKFLKEN